MLDASLDSGSEAACARPQTEDYWMARYALWNNKGGVGKSFLTFSLACEYAISHPDEDVLVLDLCPQANITEMLFGG